MPSAIITIGYGAFQEAIATRDYINSKVKVINYVDDYTLNKMLVTPYMDGYIVENLPIKKELIALGVDASKIAVSALPIESKYYDPSKKEEADALNNMSASFEEMIAMLSETETGNKQILSLVETLDGNKNSILDSVESLSSVSEETAASTQETSASLSMIDTNMGDVVNQAENLKHHKENKRSLSRHSLYLKT